MANNAFKESLKESVPCIKAEELQRKNATQLLLSQLGLFPVPENIEATISENEKYLNLKLKEANTNEHKHLLFQFPLDIPDFHQLENRSDYRDLISRYYNYTSNYIDEILNYALMEREFLYKTFPELILNMKIRIKSFDSYIEKLSKNAKDNKDLYINDIIAERIIPSEYKGSSDEQILIYMCYEAAKALYDFRSNTNFRMKTTTDSNPAHTDKKYITKDYIKHQKDNGYQTLHILLGHNINSDLSFETQIRTLNMENSSKKSQQIAHTQYKPRILNDLSPSRTPIYLGIVIDKNGKASTMPIPFENRFYHYFNSDRNFKTLEDRINNPAITYKKFRDEQYQLEQILGIPFREIRGRIKDLTTLKIKEVR